MNSNQPFAKFALHFIRSNGGSSSNDDMITIQPKWRSLNTNEEISLLEYEVSTVFSGASMISKKPQVSKMRLMGNTLLTYVENLLNLALLDSEPFESIQIDAPCVPSVLIKLNTMPNAVEHILQIVQVCLSNWPTVQNPLQRQQTNVPVPVARHITFNDEANQRTYFNNY